ncbi:MAG: radical SAM protein [Sedimentisphaerales bacterium]|nr:radical SAM protein [Sedimentisphaerales bacterium]
MFLSNLPTVLRMAVDPRLMRFVLGLHQDLSRRQRVPMLKYAKGLLAMARGERIIRFDGRYVLSSFIPPLPSRAFSTFLKATETSEGGKGLLHDLAQGWRLAPLSTYLQVTQRCNLSCAHCSAKFAALSGELNTSDWTAIIGALQDLGTAYLGFTGGEPLLRQDLEKLIAAADDRSVTILFTNGFELSSERARALKDTGLFALSVSLDSSSQQKHNETRSHPEAFRRALDAISFARKAGLYTVVQSVIPQRELSKDNLFELFRLVHAHGAHEVRVHQPAAAGRLLDDLDCEGVFLTEEDRLKLVDIQSQANRKLFGFPRVSSFPYTEGPEKFGCTAGLLHSYVTAQGDLTPCDFVPLSFGNVLTENLADIYRRMRQSMGPPKLRCVARRLAPYLVGKALPIPPTESAGFCDCVQSEGCPEVFRLLREMF